VIPVAYSCLGHVTTAADVHAKNVAALKDAIKPLSALLESQHFLVGDNLTVADILAAGSLVMAF